jgi:hypothetical protein
MFERGNAKDLRRVQSDLACRYDLAALFPANSLILPSILLLAKREKSAIC